MPESPICFLLKNTCAERCISFFIHIAPALLIHIILMSFNVAACGAFQQDSSKTSDNATNIFPSFTLHEDDTEHTKKNDDMFLYNLMMSRPDKFAGILSQSEKYEIKIIYTQINRNSKSIPQFKNYTYRMYADEYFNPASLVKLPVSCMALQKLNTLNIPHLNKNTRLEIKKKHACQDAVTKDPCSPEGYPTIGNYIIKMLVASDNDAYNRLYEFLGQEFINKTLCNMEYNHVRIIRRFNNCSPEDNRYTNPFIFFDKNNKSIYIQKMKVNPDRIINPHNKSRKGTGYINKYVRFIMGPYSYEHDNNLPLHDIHQMLVSIFYPESFNKKNTFKLTRHDRDFLKTYLSLYPADSDLQCYSSRKRYPDNYKKYFIYGDMPADTMHDTSIKIYNVVGRSDGYISDCAYIVNKKHNIYFFLSAVIYVNKNNIIKDSKYEYETVGLPFLAELGRTVYEYEKERTVQVSRFH